MPSKKAVKKVNDKKTAEPSKVAASEKSEEVESQENEDITTSESLEEHEVTDANESKAKPYDISNINELFELIRDESEEKVKEEVKKEVRRLKTKYGLDSYLFILLIDDNNSISDSHSDKIYQAISKADKKDIYLIIQSPGGSVGAAYLISKTCQRLKDEKFIVAIPRKAKSAATLLALGADEIHMGLMSELGPIDPQVGGYPALGLANALNKLAELSTNFPQSSEMFASYLTKKLELNHLGFFERISESAIQYAERLLSNKVLANDQTPSTLSNHFVNHYKDHGFVIDIEESTSLLGSDTVKSNTPEYECANEIYTLLDLVKMLMSIVHTKDFVYVGNIDSGLQFNVKNKP